ncbi:MAG: DUF2809 domain-containing protein [Flavobacterium sp.]
MFKFNKTYFGLFLLVFCIEILIAIYVRDRFIRPYMGDVLCIVLMYVFIKSFWDTPVLPTAFFALMIGITVETLQYFNFVERLGIENKALKIILGMSFEWTDYLTYIAGFAVILIGEKLNMKPKKL